MSNQEASPSVEEQRLAESVTRTADWRRWGTYLPERQWGTVREDDSPDGNPWSFTYDHSRYKAYRWGEDGLLGWTDRECRLCYSTSFWNGKDVHLKERLFGLTNSQGNHGEDVKELYYYLDATPTHSYARGLYKYPHAAFPYQELIEVNRQRGYNEPEFELLDTGVFDEERYYDCEIEYAKQAPDDILIRLSVTNRSTQSAELTILPTLYFRNTWGSNTPELIGKKKPVLARGETNQVISAEHETLGDFKFSLLGEESDPGALAPILFAENESNFGALGMPSPSPNTSSKDAFDRFVVQGDTSALCSDNRGTKAAFVLRATLEPGETRVYRLRLAEAGCAAKFMSSSTVDEVFHQRRSEADAFYARKLSPDLSDEEHSIARQAYAGLLWSKQFYFYVGQKASAEAQQATAQTEAGRKRDESWPNLFCRDILSVPDKWEYPWFAAWDSAFQLVSIAQLDPDFAKRQLLLYLGEDYLHPVGQLPAYEFNFSDVNPPVHAWAVLKLFERDATSPEEPDYDFLERAFHKLLLNFTWWVNRLDPEGKNLFGGGFLGLDNIGVFDRSALPPEDHLGQADGTAWMGFFCATMLTIALELAQHNPVYEGLVTKFFQHYIAIIDAFNTLGGTGLWDEEDGFFFDKLVAPGHSPCTLRVRSIVGIVPLYGLCILPQEKIKHLPALVARVRWARENRPDLASFIGVTQSDQSEGGENYFISLIQEHRIPRIAQRVFASSEFLSPYGVRALSRSYHDHPYSIELSGKQYTVRYAPAEGDSNLFGGNSNWRGPIWFPVNVLLIEAIERYGKLLGDTYTLEYPAHSGEQFTLLAVAADLATRLSKLFLFDSEGRRPCHGAESRYARGAVWQDLLLFSEYFSGDTGRGLGASHQTGWTALVSLCLVKAHRLRS